MDYNMVALGEKDPNKYPRFTGKYFGAYMIQMEEKLKAANLWAVVELGVENVITTEQTKAWNSLLEPDAESTKGMEPKELKELKAAIKKKYQDADGQEKINKMKNTIREKFEQRETMAIRIIKGTLADACKTSVIKLGSSKEVWDTLLKQYFKITKRTKAELSHQFETCTKGTKSIDAFVNELWLINQERIAMGVPGLGDDTIVVRLIAPNNGLGDEFSELVDTLLHLDESKTTLEYVWQSLVEKEQRISKPTVNRAFNKNDKNESNQKENLCGICK